MTCEVLYYVLYYLIMCYTQATNRDPVFIRDQLQFEAIRYVPMLMIYFNKQRTTSTVKMFMHIKQKNWVTLTHVYVGLCKLGFQIPAKYPGHVINHIPMPYQFRFTKLVEITLLSQTYTIQASLHTQVPMW